MPPRPRTLLSACATAWLLGPGAHATGVAVCAVHATPSSTQTQEAAARAVRREPLSTDVHRTQALEGLKPAAGAPPPPSLDSLKLQALLLSDLGRTPEAIALLEPLLELCPGDAELWRIRGYAATVARDPLGVLRAHGRELQQQPEGDEGRSAMTEALYALGSPHGAALWLKGEPSLTHRGHVAGRHARWGGQLWPRDPLRRHDDTDRALAELDAVIAQARDRLPEREAQDVLTRAEMDRALALQQRDRPQEARAQIDRLRERGVTIPPWLRAIEAGVLLRLREPEASAQAYDEVLAAMPDHEEARIGRIHAAVEREQWDDAFARVDALVADAHSPQTQLEARTFAALVRSYADLPAQAWPALQELSDAVPGNAGLRLSRANVAAARSWTRWADEEIKIAASRRTSDKAAQLAQAESNLRLGEYAQARESLADLWPAWSDDAAVQRLARDVRTADGGELDVRAGFERGQQTSTNSPANAHELTLRLRSPRLEDSGHWRLLAGIDRDRSRPLEGDITRTLTGVGLGWLAPWLQVRAWAWARDGGAASPGASLETFWQATDHWGFAASHAERARQTPVRAELSGITARHSAVTAQYRWHESLSVTTDIEQLAFSDGNRAQGITLHGQWRAWEIPMNQLTLRPYLSHTTHSRPGGPYFAPRSADSLSVDAEYEQTVWRRHERSFTHRLTASLGQYAQADVDRKPVLAARYEQSWHPQASTELHWGVTWGSRPYDGITERSTGLYARWVQRY